MTNSIRRQLAFEIRAKQRRVRVRQALIGAAMASLIAALVVTVLVFA